MGCIGMIAPSPGTGWYCSTCRALSSTQWLHKYCSKAYKWIIFAPRVKFLRPSGIPFEGSPKFGSFACVFDDEGRRSISCPLVEFVSLKESQ